MRKPCGKLHKIPAVGLAVLLLCCTPTAGCGKYEQTAPLPEQTGALPESTESSESAALSEAMEPAEEAAPEDQEGAFCFDPDLANFVYSGKMIFVNEDQAREQGRGILTLQLSFLDSRMKNCVDYFNSHNDDYYIAIQEIGYGEELKTCREHTLVELNAGRGPDIFEGDTFLTVTQSILDKGVLMDLAPLLDGLGITDEKYFPAIRALADGTHVYGISTYVRPYTYSILESVLGSREQPDIEALVDRLYSYPDQTAVWWPGAPYYLVLDYLLSGSEDLRGTIDWEAGRCDFTGEFFAKVLEVAKRYGDPGRNGQTAVVYSYEPGRDSREELASEGKVILDFPFDDEWFPYCDNSHTLMVNANTKYPEGVQAFIKFLLGPVGQTYFADGSTCSLPVNREMAASYKAWQLKENQEGSSHHFRTENGVSVEFSLTEELIDELMDYTNQARYLPLKTEEIMSIINEEAYLFFTGDKPLEMVIDLIQNRVQLYLDEHM